MIHSPPTFLEGWGMGAWIDRAYIDSLIPGLAQDWSLIA